MSVVRDGTLSGAGRLSRLSLKEQALEVIRNALVSGQMRPGVNYSATSLAQKLGTSNGPVREAMLTLVDQGIMEVVPNRGFRVAPMTDHDLDEVHELRVMLEVPAMAKLAREGLSEVRAAAARDRAQKCEDAARAQDVNMFMVYDRDFHLALLGFLDNARLVRFVSQLRDQTRLYGLPALAKENRLLDSAKEHFDLLDAVGDQDPKRASKVMEQHLAHIRDDWAASEPTGI